MAKDLITVLVNTTSVEARDLLVSMVQSRAIIKPENDIMHVSGQKIANYLRLQYDTKKQRNIANQKIEELFNELSTNVAYKLDTGEELWHPLLIVGSTRETYKSETEYKIEFILSAWTEKFSI